MAAVPGQEGAEGGGATTPSKKGAGERTGGAMEAGRGERAGGGVLGPKGAGGEGANAPSEEGAEGGVMAEGERSRAALASRAGGGAEETTLVQAEWVD
eukprot:1962005-Rhodomonas_salina.1